MAKQIYGNRIGKDRMLRPSVNALIFDSGRKKILLTRRSDNGLWCVPGGAIDSGESVEEACIREVVEETGLLVRVTKLVGVYSTPHKIIRYADGNEYQSLNIVMETEIIGGELTTSEETTEVGYFDVNALDQMDLMGSTLDRIEDALAGMDTAFIR